MSLKLYLLNFFIKSLFKILFSMHACYAVNLFIAEKYLKMFKHLVIYNCIIIIYMFIKFIIDSSGIENFEKLAFSISTCIP